MESGVVQTIIITRTDKIGDFVVSIPSYATARAMFPRAKIIALVSRFNRIIAENVSCIDECVSIDDYEDVNELAQKLRSYKPDAFVALVSNNKISKLAVQSGARMRIGPRSKILSFIHYNHGIRQHRSLCQKSEAAYNLELIRKLDPRRFDEVGVQLSRIKYQQEHADVVDAYLKEHKITPQRFILVNPFTGGSGANLSLDQYGAVLDAILSGQNPYLNSSKYLVSPSGADIAADADMGNNSFNNASEDFDGQVLPPSTARISAYRQRLEFYEDQQAYEEVAPRDINATVTDGSGSGSGSQQAAMSGVSANNGSADAALNSGNASTFAERENARAAAESAWSERAAGTEGAIVGDYLAHETTDEDGSVTWSFSRRDSDSAAMTQRNQEREDAFDAAQKAASDASAARVPAKVIILGMRQHEEQMQEILKQISPEMHQHVHLFINEGSLLVAVALVDRCKVFIGPSTGITQIAGNYQKPAICFYSSRISNSHRRWELFGDPEEVAFTFNIKNLNPNNKVLSKLQDGMKHALVSTVLEEFYRTAK